MTVPDPAVAAAYLKRLVADLEVRQPAVERFDAYYRGDHPLAFATAKFRQEFGALLKAMGDNWCQLVVDASVERLKVEGFRFGPGDESADADAWSLWQANFLDADQVLAHTEASKSGIAYVLVLPGEDPETPRITVEHPHQAITHAAPGNRRHRLAGLKRWAEDDGTLTSWLYLPDGFFHYERVPRAKGDALVEVVPNPVGVVPLVPMENLPGMLFAGMSDLHTVIPLQDAINKLLADMIVNSEFVAYPQRYVTGIDVPTDPITGRPLDREQFLSSTSRLWVAEPKDAVFGELAGSDGLGYVRQIEALVQHLAAQTRTPPHYLLGSSGSFPSGESLKATETGLVAKCRRKHTTYGETWEEAMRLAFAYRGDSLRAGALSAEVIWADPESKSIAELVDALVKLDTLGVPRTAIWEAYGASPQQIERWSAAAAEAAAQEPAAPPTPTPAVPAEQPVAT